MRDTNITAAPNCPTCGNRFSTMGCSFSDMPLHWCPNCGTLRTCEGLVATPARELEKRLVTA